MISFKLDAKAQERLTEAMKRVPDKAVKLTNEVLKSYGAPEVVRSIIGFTPASGRSWAGKESPAKNEATLSKKMEDLGFTIKPKTSWSYLVFPNKGIGRSNPIAQRFFEAGLENANERVLNKVAEALEKAVEVHI